MEFGTTTVVSAVNALTLNFGTMILATVVAILAVLGALIGLRWGVSRFSLWIGDSATEKFRSRGVPTYHGRYGKF